MIQSNLNEVILFLIEQTNKKAKQHSALMFDQRGIDVTVDQWVLMKFVQENPGLSQTELAKETFKDAASITRILDLLTKKGLIIRESIAGNRRKFSIHLSHEGQSFIAKHMDFVQNLRDQSIQGLSEDEILILTKSLLQIQKNFE
ncbi:MAG: MarR family transcriptional regulator [Cyclobacteriaceae bacterium]